MYFTKYSRTDGSEKIYKAKYSQGTGNQGEWSVDTDPMSFCSGQSTYTHPALSVDGKIMIFASNQPGTIGEMDLFITRKNGESWTDPVNLGKAINTKSNELFPFLDSENNLYFSSDGFQIYGGYDIFVCKFKAGNWEKPVNLSTPVNTIYDDVAFTVNRKDGKSAFYTVKQKSGKRSMQLFMVKMNSITTPKNLANLSQLFTNPGLMEIKLPETITAAADVSVKKLPDKTETKTEVIKKEPEAKTKQEIIPEEPKKEIKAVEIPVKQAAISEEKAGTKQQTQVKVESKVEPVKVATSETSVKKDVVVYRVQILSNTTAKGSYKITINNRTYNTFEYFYSGGYRTCIGEFSTLEPAKELQSVCRNSGYPQAFVAAFKNNVRSTDLSLFK
jgi:outer membrane biosynthesis protein TonB